MSLLFSQEIKDTLAQELATTSEQVHIVSAYCKHEAMIFIEENIKPSVKSKKLLVRFTLNDIICGASDMSLYNFCKENNWELYFRLDLHAKTYIFDKMRCIVGSANATSKGIGLIDNSNYEIAHVSEISGEEMQKVEKLFSGAVLMTDDIFHKMEKCLENTNLEKIASCGNWDKKILSLFNAEINVLFTHEFPNCHSLSELKEDSLDFLFLRSGWDIQTVKKAFVSSNSFLWLVQTLEAVENNEIYFGALTEQLHATLLNDPKPYRKEVKELLSNLLNWTKELCVEQIIIDRPNYSQRIRLKIN